MRDYDIIALFCHLDDQCKLRLISDSRQEMSQSEVMLAALIAARVFGGNLRKACQFLKEHGYCPRMLSESRFNRRLHMIPEELWTHVMRGFCPEEVESKYIIDSFPVPTCRMVRKNRVHLFYGGHFLGYSASHKMWFSGLKVHLLITASAHPVAMIISPGSEHDLTGLKLIDTPLPKESLLYGDKAYTDYAWEENLLQEKGIKLVAERKSNSKRPHPKEIEKDRRKIRKNIETAISGIVRLMPRWIQAVTERGFELKLTLFVIAFASMQLAS
ncbi:IS982 family transposase [Rhabdochlamydiaceae symbiont of Dictyostelium giganteum]|uniref:IS982 family transposase n=1 Tax=Rhabdochlamydiaceae symbiont of Dictyostelium giganteum TaxID=3342349 RepID=UPI00384E7E17